MAYTPTYDSTDISAVVIDIIVGIAVVMVGFAGLIGLLLLYRWFKTGKFSK